MSIFGIFGRKYARAEELGQSLNAAQADFKLILEQQNVLDTGKELAQFAQSFESSYKLREKILVNLEKAVKPKGDMIRFSNITIENLEHASNFAEAVNYRKGYQSIEDSRNFGLCFGTLMACIEYGLSSGYFDSQDYQTRACEIINESVKSIHKIAKKVILKNLATKILAIYKSKGTTKILPHNFLYDRMMTKISYEFSESG